LSLKLSLEEVISRLDNVKTNDTEEEYIEFCI